MSEFRGSKGSIKIGANIMANVTSWRLTLSRPVLDRTSQGDAVDKVGLDTPSGEGEITVRYDYGDAAQAALTDILVSDADSAPVA